VAITTGGCQARRWIRLSVRDLARLDQRRPRREKTFAVEF
jgi:hypothetical protein